MKFKIKVKSFYLSKIMLNITLSHYFILIETPVLNNYNIAVPPLSIYLDY